MDTKFRDSARKPLGPMIDKEIEKMKNLVVIKDNKAKIYLKESTKSMKYDLCEKNIYYICGFINPYHNGRQ